MRDSSFTLISSMPAGWPIYCSSRFHRKA